MGLKFYKYQGTGNDFIIIDNRDLIFDKNNANLIAELCDRRFGIGADGLILLENHASLDFEMVYFNSDGHPSTMCGNGGRCIVAFAKFLNLINEAASFMAVDGRHEASVLQDGRIDLQMQDVKDIKQFPDHLFLDTGSPHHVELVEDIEHYDVNENGARIRYGTLYNKKGSNINFVQQLNEDFRLRTYERGVEGETLSCGTGATAVAIAVHKLGLTSKEEIRLQTQGGLLQVRFDVEDSSYSNVRLIGPAVQVFKGEI